MALTLAFPAAGSRMGPGLAIQLTTATTPLDTWFWEAEMHATVGGTVYTFAYGNVPALAGVQNGYVTFGITEYFGFWQGGGNVGLADGAAVSMTAHLKNASGVSQDALGSTSMLWDAASGAQWLLQYYFTAGVLSKIYSAVHRDLTMPGQQS